MLDLNVCPVHKPSTAPCGLPATRWLYSREWTTIDGVFWPGWVAGYCRTHADDAFRYGIYEEITRQEAECLAIHDG